MLTEEFVAAIAALLNDLESLEVRVAAIELLAHVWDAAGGGQRPSSPSPHSSPGRSPARIKVRRDGQEGGGGDQFFHHGGQRMHFHFQGGM